MQPISSAYLTTQVLPENPRFRVKGKDLYLEFPKPNIFKRIWRHITGQYNRTKIISAVDSLAKGASKASSLKELNTLISNLEKLEQRIPNNEDLHHRVDKIKNVILPAVFEHTSAAQKWKKANLSPGEEFSEILNENIVDLEGTPDRLGWTNQLISAVLGCRYKDNSIDSQTYRMANPAPKVIDVQKALGIATLNQCLALDLGTDYKNFEDFFAENRPRLTQILLDRGFIVRI